jgi:hypothetical protein
MRRATVDRVAQGEPARACRHCGATFEPTFEAQAFCRPSCRRAHLPPPNPQRRLPLDDPASLFDEPFEVE